MGKGSPAPAPQPSTITQNTSSIPEYARPYFEDIMQRGQAASQVQYQPYTGERVAGFSPLQDQAFQGIQSLGVSPLMTPATNMTGAAGIGGLTAGSNYTQQATSPGAMQAYMSPYMQNVVDWQKTQAINDYGRQLPGMNAAATRAGAFGGSRQAIVEAEGQRNLQNQLAGIQAQGTQSAFDAARQAQQFGSQLGLQGLGLTGQMGAQFGQLGQQAFGQQAAALQAQQQAGAIQQAQEQQRKDLAYEEFMRQQLYPQSQLQFLSSLLRGSVVAPQQTMYTYQQQPSMVSQLGGLGLGALGLSNAFKAKDGGEVPGYADGGITGGRGVEQGITQSRVTKARKEILQGVIPKDQMAAMIALKQLELEKAKSNQQALDAYRQQAQQPTVYDEEMGKLASAGVAGLDAGVMDDRVFAAAGGGIVAFNQGGSKGREVDVGAMTPDEFERYNRQQALSGALGTVGRGLATPFTAFTDVVQTAVHPIREGLYTLGIGEEKNPEIKYLTPRLWGYKGEQAGVPAALPKKAAPEVPYTQAMMDADNSRKAAPGTQPTIPPARPALTPGQAIKPAEDELMKFNKIEKLDPAAREAEYRKAMEEKFPSELKDRLEELKAQGQQAVKDRDADRWLAVAMGGFAAAAGQSPYALQNFAQGLGLTTKEMATINKDFRKAEDLRNKAIREERKADRLERMGIDDKARDIRSRAEKFNLDATKVDNDLKAHLAQTAAYKEANRLRAAEIAGARKDAADARKDLQTQRLEEAARLREASIRQAIDKTPEMQGYGSTLQSLYEKLLKPGISRSDAEKTQAQIRQLEQQRQRVFDAAVARAGLGPQAGANSGLTAAQQALLDRYK